MRLQAKLTLTVIASIAIGLIGMALLVSVLANVFSSGYQFTDLEGISADIQATVAAVDPAGEPALQALLSDLAPRFPGIELEWLRPDGTLIYASTGRTEPYDVAEMTARFVNQATNIFAGEPISVPYAVTGAGGDGFLVLTLHPDITRLFQLYITVGDPVTTVLFLIPLLLVLLIPTMAAIVFSTLMIRRLNRLNTAVQGLDLHQPVLPVTDPSRDEIGQLTGLLARMSGRISSQVEQLRRGEAQRRQLVANLSHDLRSPLTVVRGYAETLAAEPADRTKVRQWSRIISGRARYMDELLSRLFAISRPDGVVPPLDLTPTNLSELLRRIVLDYVDLLDDRRIAVDARLPVADVWLPVDAPRLERAVRNLIDNAIEYGDAGRYLGIELRTESGNIRLSVIDRGQGIPARDIPHLFEAYFRVSRARSGEGLGLGLPMVATVAAAHGGQVTVTSEPGELTVFTITLPTQTVSG